MVKSAAITMRPSPRLSLNCLPIRTICCASNRSDSSGRRVACEIGMVAAGTATSTEMGNLADRLRTRAWPLVASHSQIVAIFVLRQSVDDLGEIGLADETHAECDLL